MTKEQSTESRMTASALRELVGDIISHSIDMHRQSRRFIHIDDDFLDGRPTDEEIDDFLASNPLLDEETVEQLIDPGLLGFFAKEAIVQSEWLSAFRDNIKNWSENQKWLTADLPWLDVEQRAEESQLWIPGSSVRPGWIDTSPSSLLLAVDLLNQGRLLSELSWRDFERVIAELLEREGWKVTLTRGTKDGGVDVIAEKQDTLIGSVRTLWQAKKYGPGQKVQLAHIREMSAIRADEKATKAVVVTTSHLTRGAIDWIKRDAFQLGYKDQEDVERWLRRVFLNQRLF